MTTAVRIQADKHCCFFFPLIFVAVTLSQNLIDYKLPSSGQLAQRPSLRPCKESVYEVHGQWLLHRLKLLENMWKEKEREEKERYRAWGRFSAVFRCLLSIKRRRRPTTARHKQEIKAVRDEQGWYVHRCVFFCACVCVCVCDVNSCLSVV